MPTEKRIIPSATVEDIDLGPCGRSCGQGLDRDERIQPAREDDLGNGGMVDELAASRGRRCTAWMVLGREPEAYAHTVRLFVQCTAYEGTEQVGEVLSARGRQGSAAGPGAAGDGVV